MHIHILGICGTFMGGIAALAKALGFTVTGSDKNVYPPMSTQLERLQIELHEGWQADRLAQLKPDLVLVGNQLSRGNPMVEALLESDIPFESAPAWLNKHVLKKPWVIAVAGTHGKTTTTSMLAWILEKAGMNPGFLIGGKPKQFGSSARLGDGQVFVIEADEYDTAFFDKRSKFVHYWPKTCIINNLEFDHADIFHSLADIQKQFHHLVREVPVSGLIIHPQQSSAIDEVLEQGCWSMTESIGPKGIWGYKTLKADASAFELYFRGHKRGTVEWDLCGEHQVYNAMSAIAAARHVGVELEVAMEAIESFELPKRRLEHLGTFEGITLYDDFAHHPTAIETTLKGLKSRIGEARLGLILDLRSNTMRAGHHQHTLAGAVEQADMLAVHAPEDIDWPVDKAFADHQKHQVFAKPDDILPWFKQQARSGDHWVVMSNGGFAGIYQKLEEVLGQGKEKSA